MDMSEKLNILMKQNNIKNPKELSEKLNKQNLKIPYTTLLTIINNEVQDIKLNTARKLCDFFHITLDDLLDDNINIDDYTLDFFKEAKERYGESSFELLRNYSKLNNLGKKTANQRVEELTEVPKYTEKNELSEENTT